MRSLVKVNQLDGPEVTSLDQLRLAAALLEAGDRRGYEQWRQSIVARFTPAAAPLPASIIKACLLLPAESGPAPVACGRLGSGHDQKWQCTPESARPLSQGVAWSDAKVLFEYRRGDFAETRTREISCR